MVTSKTCVYHLLLCPCTPLIRRQANILIDNEFHVQLCDFGLTFIAGNAGIQTTMIGGRGTHSWMSPERLFEEDHQLTEADDVYAYACVCYYVISSAGQVFER
jgi:serine/threonine protein kinase